jgi:hypothetical protein
MKLRVQDNAAPHFDGGATSNDVVSREKATGAYYTPDAVVRSLVSWAVRKTTDRLLDPSCGDGRFLSVHPRSVGVEQDVSACKIVHIRVPGSLIHQGDFFSWASRTQERFDCAAGNPPFIRYQRFAGFVRNAAQQLCERHGASFSSLSSSWAPFLVATASLLKPGGRMAFVVPAEIGHAPYAVPVLDYMTRRFERVQVIAVRRKLFPELSEDCWLLYADGFGGSAKFGSRRWSGSPSALGRRAAASLSRSTSGGNGTAAFVRSFCPMRSASCTPSRSIPDGRGGSATLPVSASAT